jgi:uncharacterized protein YuzE
MKIDYDKETDLLYIYLESKVPSVGMETKNDDVIKFVAKKDKRTIGFEIENTSSNLDYIRTELKLKRIQLIAIYLLVDRKLSEQTQEEYKDVLNVSLSTYKAIERANTNIGIETIDLVLENTTIDLSPIFQRIV